MYRKVTVGCPRRRLLAKSLGGIARLRRRQLEGDYNV